MATEKKQQAVTGTLAARIKSLAKRMAGTDATVQGLAIDVLEQSIVHRNYTYLNMLFLAMTKGHNRDALGRYLIKYGNIKPNMGKERKEVPFVLDDTRTGDLEGARATSWVSFSVAQASAAKLFDEASAVQGLIARLLKGEGFKNPDHAKELGAALQKVLEPVISAH
jgi:hypothetical protein